MSTQTGIAIEEVTGLYERSLLQRTLANQAFWVTVAVGLICLATAWESRPRSRPSATSSTSRATSPPSASWRSA